MNSIPWITYLVLAGVAVVQAVLLALQTWEHRRYARSCMRNRDSHRPLGRAMILAPCKGAEFALEENLRACCGQDYGLRNHVHCRGCRRPGLPGDSPGMADVRPTPARLLVAGLAAGGGQKVHNLRIATAALPPEIRYLVFVDSDAQPRPDWLRSLL